MKHASFIVFALGLLFLFDGCKEEVKAPITTSIEIEQAVVNVVVEDTTLLSDEAIAKSLFEKIKLIPELERFQKLLNDTKLQKLLQTKKGPFTVFVPNNAFFKSIPNDSTLSSVKKDSILKSLYNYVVEGNISSIDIVQKIRKHKGVYRLETLSGAVISLSRKDFDIVIKAKANNTAILGKTDISASNGLLHIVQSEIESN